jgi:hypothetical protein
MSLIAHTLTKPAAPQLTMKITVPKRDELDCAHTHEASHATVSDEDYSTNER